MKIVVELPLRVITCVGIVICALTVLAIIMAYNDIGPVRFIGGYPGF